MNNRLAKPDRWTGKASLLVVIALVCSAAWWPDVAVGNAPDPADSPAGKLAFQGKRVSVERPTLPGVRLATAAGFDDDAALAQSISDRVARLEALPEGDVAALDRAESLLAAANLILARQVEPACSRKLLRIDGGEDHKASAMLDHADRLIAQAGALAGKPALPVAEQEKDAETVARRVALTRNQKRLHAFSVGLRAFLLTGKSDDVSSRVRQSASVLSPLIEDEDPSVSAAATLWRACLRSDESDIPRALSVLDLALKKPAKGAMPYAFFSSIERCRLLAMQGGRATALALLMQLEGRCEEWFDEADQRTQAEKLVQFVQMQIVLDWYDAKQDEITFEEKNRQSQLAGRQSRLAGWCADRIERMKADGFETADNSLFRLGTAIPIIVKSPAEKVEG